MTATHSVLYICAYFLGLLLSAYKWGIFGLPIGAIVLLGAGCLAALIVPRYWRMGLNYREWLIVGLIGCVAVFYCEVRSPKPDASDISQFFTELNQAAVPVVVEGQVASAPRQTRSQNKQFWLQVVNAKPTSDSGELDSKSGRLYVTLSAQQANDLKPGQGVRLMGTLYAPKAATSPGSFDFKQYLERQGCFAGFRVKEIGNLEAGWNPGLWLSMQGRISYGLWRIRERVNTAFAKHLGNTNHAALISGMILGRKAVDLPPDISDAFTQAGMAHTLAASGFHVSLLLGMVLWFTRSLLPSQQAGIGVSILLGYIALTGIQPSIMRAGLMGIGALVGRVYDQKLQPVGVLVVVAFLLLLINPPWIFHLGFQLSFLATLGLLVTAPPLTKALDWLPSSVATAIAIPISAYLWTLPVQLFSFGTVSTYSIFVNLLTTPLVIILSLGGMMCAAIALISPDLGSWAVWPLQFPAGWLIHAVEKANALPGSVYAVGQIATYQLILLYGLYGWVWWKSKWQVLPWLAGGMAIALMFIPGRLSAATQSPITFLNTVDEPVVVIQHRGEVGLIHSGSEADIQFTVLPFLKKQGVNRIDWAIANQMHGKDQERWNQIADTIPITDVWISEPTFAQIVLHGIKQVKPINYQQTTSIGSLNITVLNQEPKVMSFSLGDRTWLMFQSDSPGDQQTLSALDLPQVDVLQWAGNVLPTAAVTAAQPMTVIGEHLAEFTQEPSSLIPNSFSLENGAVQWNSRRKPYQVVSSTDFD